MPEVKMTAVCRVNIVERERGWGSKIIDKRYFDNWDEARAFVRAENESLPDGPAPDYYIQAEGPYAV